MIVNSWYIELYKSMMHDDGVIFALLRFSVWKFIRNQDAVDVPMIDWI